MGDFFGDKDSVLRHLGQSMEALMILIGTFLAINLTLSALMNAYNNRVVLRSTTR